MTAPAREGAHGRGVSIWVLGLLFGPLALLIGARAAIADNSYLWHITAGRIQLETGRVLATDPFSFTAQGAPWRTQSWLAELAYGWSVDRWGIEAGRWVAPLAGGVFFLIVAVILGRHLRVGFAMAALTAMTATLTIAYMNPRPVVFSYLTLALVVLASQHPGLRWTIPITTWLWAGLHGSYILAVVFLGLEWVRTRDSGFLKIGAVSLVASQLTAHGLALNGVLIEFVGGRDALARISEWRPPELLSWPSPPVLVGLVLLVAYASRRNVTWREGVPLVMWFLFGLTAVRSIPVMWIALLPQLSTYSAEWEGTVGDRARLPAPVLAVAGVGVLAISLLVPYEAGLDEEVFPIEAASRLTEPRVFHADAVGGYLIYSQWPDRLVYIDDRAELFQDQYVAFADTYDVREDWRGEFDKWSIDQALLPRDATLAQLLRSEGWGASYEDVEFVVLDRPQ
jgi:hypothetical protein